MKKILTQQTIETSSERYRNILSEISTKIDRWKKMIAIEKVTFDIMNKFDFRVQGSAIAQCWVPKKKIEEFKKEVTLAEKSANVQVGTFLEEVKTKQTPPTYFETNKVTAVFQDMINAFAIPSYKEINPVPITMVTFPFLFAVMFGDVGNAIMLFLAALFMVVFEKPLKETMESNEMLVMVYQGRYLLLMMGTVAIYTGLLYNDVFGLVLNLFGSRYKFDGHGLGSFNGRTYEFGVDPAWYETVNKLLYYNSLKMKMAIVFGVLHMLTGIVVKFLNFLYFRKYAYIFMEAIPEFLILASSFGYLSFMIVFKWCVPWIQYKAVAPDLLQTMTNYFLHPFDDIPYKLYAGQEYVQITLLFIFGGCIPLLLFPGTIYEIAIGCAAKRKHAKKVTFAGSINAAPEDHHDEDHHDKVEEVKSDDALLHQNEVHSEDSSAPLHPAGGHEEEEEEEEFNIQETVIHHLIHTIEFTLNSVSNTASYLRLWALSLAHAQLSEVFFQLTIKLSLSLGGLIEGVPVLVAILDYSGIPLFLAYTLWIFLSIGILLMMETLSAFLHALRLHWVEFQSKFYGGNGHLFQPLSFNSVMKETRVEIATD
jgi:V-type H+-transporting ATPase subunit a